MLFSQMAPEFSEIGPNHPKWTKLMSRTGMKEEWAKDTLQNNAWDAEAAFGAFQKAKSQVLIPPTAFVT